MFYCMLYFTCDRSFASPTTHVPAPPAKLDYATAEGFVQIGNVQRLIFTAKVLINGDRLRVDEIIQ